MRPADRVEWPPLSADAMPRWRAPTRPMTLTHGADLRVVEWPRTNMGLAVFWLILREYDVSRRAEREAKRTVLGGYPTLEAAKASALLIIAAGVF